MRRLWVAVNGDDAGAICCSSIYHLRTLTAKGYHADRSLLCVRAAIALAHMHVLETHVHQASNVDGYIYAAHETSTRLIQAMEVCGSVKQQPPQGNEATWVHHQGPVRVFADALPSTDSLSKAQQPPLLQTSARHCFLQPDYIELRPKDHACCA